MPASAAAFSMEAKMFEARVLRFRCTLKNPRWAKFPEPSTTASLRIISWFWDVKPQIVLLVLVSISVSALKVGFNTYLLYPRKIGSETLFRLTVVVKARLMSIYAM